MLLTPASLARLEKLSLATRRRIAGAFPGEHRSRRLGSSVDFADWRPYIEGDDFRRIDYQIYARLDRLVVRLYEAEEELDLRVVLDGSASMRFDGKFEAASRLAAALSYLAALRRDRARVWVCDGGGVRPSPWARSRDSAIRLFDWLERVEPEGSTDLRAALRVLSAAGGLRGMTVLISDLMTPDWEEVVRRLGGPGADAAVLHVVSAGERDPALRGDLLLIDSETAADLEVSLSDQVLKRYRARVGRWLSAVAEGCRRRDIAYQLVSPQDDLDRLLTVELREQGVVH